MASTSDIRNGLCIKYNNDIYKIIEFLHVKPGKGPAFVRTKLKSLTNGKVLDNTFSAGHKIDEVRVETHEFQFLYAEGDLFNFMHTDTYEQISLQKDILDAPDLLKEGTTVKVIINAETEAPLSVDMPASVVLEVTYAEPGVKGNTATNATKPAKVETVDQLKRQLSKKQTEFFILLNGGFHSSKHIELSRQGRFSIMNYIDSSSQTLSEKQLFDRTITNIGRAMTFGAFYCEGE